MLSLEEALDRVLERLPPTAVEALPLTDAANRIAAATAHATVDLPAFDNSAMDGYAVRAADVRNASRDHPVRLTVTGRIAAGEPVARPVGPGECVRLFTGSPLPAGADAVVMQEETRPDPAHPGEVDIFDPVRPWESVRFRGEDLKAGAPVVQSGDRITPSRLAVLAASGTATIPVRRPPRVAVLATGSELREPGDASPLQPGQIFESNRVMLAALLSGAGALAHIHPVVRDDLDTTVCALDKAFATSDAVITSGGVSVGEYDHVKAAVQRLGGSLDLWRVAIKPGKPFVFGQFAGKPLFGLPGNPVSAFVTFLLLVRPALLHMQGCSDLSLPRHPGTLADTLSNPGDRRHFFRVRVDPEGHIGSAGLQASHRLGSLTAANGLVDVPPETVWNVGRIVQVLRFG